MLAVVFVIHDSARGTVNDKGNRYTAWKSRRVIAALEEREQNQYGETAPIQDESGAGVALSALYNARVIFSCRNCKNSRNCIYACWGMYIGKPVDLSTYALRISKHIQPSQEMATPIPLEYMRMILPLVF